MGNPPVCWASGTERGAFHVHCRVISTHISPFFMSTVGRRDPQSRDLYLLQVPQLTMHVADPGVRAHQPTFPVITPSHHQSSGPLRIQLSGLTCDFLNVAPQLFAGLGQA